jgi:hypothetical protein
LDNPIEKKTRKITKPIFFKKKEAMSNNGSKKKISKKLVSTCAYFSNP